MGNPAVLDLKEVPAPLLYLVIGLYTKNWYNIERHIKFYFAGVFKNQDP